MWRRDRQREERQRQRAVRKRHSPSYIRPREKRSLRSSFVQFLNSLCCTVRTFVTHASEKEERHTGEDTSRREWLTVRTRVDSAT